MYSENLVASGVGTNTAGNIGSGIAYDETVSAVKDRKVEKIGVFGYSHGGGSTHDLVKRLDDNRGTIGTFTIAFTAYIDAVRQQDVVTVFGTQFVYPVKEPEVRRPPSSQYHMNFYELRDLLHGSAQTVNVANPAPEYQADKSNEVLAATFTEFDVLMKPTPHLKIVAVDSIQNKLMADLKTKLELF